MLKRLFGLTKLILVLLVLSMSLHSCSCSDDDHASPSTGAVSGVLLDAQGNPIAGATIEIYDGDTLITTTTTDAEGNYSVAVPEGSGYTLQATADGYEPVIMDLDDVANGETLTVDLDMELIFGTGTIQGVVRNADNNSGIEGATVEIYDGADLVGTTTTDADGSYTVEVPAGSGYTVRVSSAGFITADYNAVNVNADETVILESILQIADTYEGDGTIEGTITDAITGDGVEAVTITLRAGLNSRTGATVATGSTDEDGNYSIDSVPTGYYTAELSCAGYITAYISVYSLGTGTTVENQNASISPVLVAGETRIVLTWGETPEDLDSHLTGPTTSGPRFHLFYQDESVSDGTVADLDNDNTDGYGPETITIRTQIAGTYFYYVNDYSNMGDDPSTALSNSGAQVKVYQESGLVATFNIPANQGGTLWAVFSLNGTTITPINTFSYADADSDPLP